MGISKIQSNSWKYIAEADSTSYVGVDLTNYSEALLVMLNASSGSVIGSTVVPVNLAKDRLVNVYFTTSTVSIDFVRMSNADAIWCSNNNTYKARLYAR